MVGQMSDYQIPDSFCFTAATMHLVDSAAHWYQFLQIDARQSQLVSFYSGSRLNLTVTTHRDKMIELLLSLKQTGSVEDYGKAFERLV